MLTPERLWYTADRELVLEGDPQALVLAYAAGDAVEPSDVAEVAQLLRHDTQSAPPPRAKVPEPSADKMVRRRPGRPRKV